LQGQQAPGNGQQAEGKRQEALKKIIEETIRQERHSNGTGLERTVSETNEIKDFKDLKAWQKAMDLCVAAYDLTRNFPKDELFGLVNQIRRASVSVPANIAEGYGRGYLADYIRFLRNSRGSLFELETEVMLAHRLGMVASQDSDAFLAGLREAARTLQGLTSSLERVLEDQERTHRR
jgi:four helix bundle protein